jgi:hypothetical protein
LNGREKPPQLVIFLDKYKLPPDKDGQTEKLKIKKQKDLKEHDRRKLVSF